MIAGANKIDRAAVVGAGAWGTALARLAALNGRDVALVARDAGHASEMAASRENRRRFPGFQFPKPLSPVSDYAALSGAGLVLLAIPSRGFGDVVAGLAPHLTAATPVVIATKGLDAATGRTLSEVVTSFIPNAPVLILSGPSFAEDVAHGLPTAVTLAGQDKAVAERVRDVFACQTFRIYLTSDTTGTALGGAAKNVLAIAAGIVEGRGLGDSARAALIARGFAELGRLVKARGGHRETVAGLSGLGDLVLTCSSPLSRNFCFGMALGQGMAVDAAVAAARGVVEGVTTAPVLAGEAVRLQLDLPILQAVAAVISEDLSVKAAIEGLLSRPLGNEF